MLKRRFVAVDDSPVMNILFKSVFDFMECEYQIFDSFDEGKGYCETKKVDVLIADLFIGTHSGFDVIHSLRSNSDNAMTKCFICSAESPELHRVKLKRYRVNGWILKPVDVYAMRSTLSNIAAKLC